MRHKTAHGRLGGPGILVLLPLLPLFIPVIIMWKLAKLAVRLSNN